MANEEKILLCNACKSKLEPNATFCKACSSWQGTPCAFCGHRLPDGAKRCNKCETFQSGWRSVFTVSQTVLVLLIALISLISPTISGIFWALSYNSSTSAIITSFDTNAASIYLWNTGRKPSRVERCFLDFGKLPYQRMELEIVDRAHSFIPVGSDSASAGIPLKLSLRHLRTRCPGEKQLMSAATLLVNVRESNDRLNPQQLHLSEGDVEKIGVKATVEGADPCK